MGDILAFKSEETGAIAPYFLSGAERRRHGVDIGQAVHAGILTIDDFRAVLAHCRACPDRRGQSADASTTLPDCTSPDWCANRAVLEGLRGIV